MYEFSVALFTKKVSYRINIKHSSEKYSDIILFYIVSHFPCLLSIILCTYNVKNNSED